MSIKFLFNFLNLDFNASNKARYLVFGIFKNAPL